MSTKCVSIFLPLTSTVSIENNQTNRTKTTTTINLDQAITSDDGDRHQTVDIADDDDDDTDKIHIISFNRQ